MLSWFRKKRKLLTPAVAAVFLGSLFSLYCPHCLAQPEPITAITPAANSNADDHCASMDAAGTEPEPSTHQPCMGNCDCEDHAVLSGEHSSVAVNAQAGSSGIKLPVMGGIPFIDLPSFSIPHTIGKPLKPDRACISPLERNCVLLN